jgi:hypothetical protein
MTVMDRRASWMEVCRYDELMPDRRACAPAGDVRVVLLCLRAGEPFEVTLI